MTDGLIAVVRIMKQQYGKDVSVFESGFLRKVVEARRLAAGLAEVPPYAERLAAEPAEAEALLTALRITYTDFFRDALVFAQLEQHILPELLQRKGESTELRVWSAGCSSGQEPYSLAMLLADLTTAGGAPARFRIFATDIVPEALAAGRSGIYAWSALANVRVKDMSSHFSESGGLYTVQEHLRQTVSFSEYDLLEAASAYPPESIYGHFDLILCRNLLIYYQPAEQQHIIGKLLQALAPEGYLVTGEAERLTVERTGCLQPLRTQAPIFRNCRN